MNSTAIATSRLGRLFAWINSRSLSLSTLNYAIVISLLNIALYNGPLFVFIGERLVPWSATGVQVQLAIFALVFSLSVVTLLLLLALSHRLGRWICIALPLVNAIALYFITHYQVILDRSMMGNVFNTNPTEAGEYFSASMLLFWLALGVLPAYLVSRIRVLRTTRLKSLGYALAIAVLGVACIYGLSGAWLWVDKHAKQLGGRILPWSYMINTVRHQSAQAERNQTQTLLPAASHLHQEKTVVVLVIGETARARNFSLYGYDRQTNPALTKRNVLALRNALACTTYTTGSLRCMLSHTEGSLLADNFEPLPSYLQRHGIEVIWRTNNWGEPPIQVHAYQRPSALKPQCRGDECDLDGVLLTGLKAQIEAASSKKILVVLHKKGSHGPAYFSRYPERFEQFSPVCKSVQLDQCSQASLLNAYDNSILYTDALLSRVIDTLQTTKTQASMMMYVSDHGESLGEYGIYLHGTPYALAPDVQKEIPFIVWMSDAFEQREGISRQRLMERNSHSHHQIFHSLMSAMGIHSEVYRPDLDIFHQP